MDSTNALKVRGQQNEVVSEWYKCFNEALINMDLMLVEHILDDKTIINDLSKWEFLDLYEK